MNVINKYVYEKFPIYADFYINLDDNETLSSYSLGCINLQTGANSKSSVVDSDSIDGTKVKTILKAGSPAGDHKVTAKIITSNDNNYEIDIILKIKDAIGKVDRFTKQVSEEFVVTTDFSNDLSSGETISSADVSAIRLSDGSVLTGDVIEFSQKSSKKVLVGVQNGSDGELYRIEIRIQTSLGYKFQKNLTMKVQER